MVTIYRDRYEAGRELATKLTAYAHRQDVLVLALPRGGVPVGYEVAKALQAPPRYLRCAQTWRPRSRGIGDGRYCNRRDMCDQRRGRAYAAYP